MLNVQGTFAAEVSSSTTDGPEATEKPSDRGRDQQEWTLLHALSRLGRSGGCSAYFRLSTRPIDQGLAQRPEERNARDARRRAALAGGYRLRTAGGRPDAALVSVGAMLPEVCEAADELEEAGMAVDVLCLTSPALVFRALQARRGPTLWDRCRHDHRRGI